MHTTQLTVQQSLVVDGTQPETINPHVFDTNPEVYYELEYIELK